MQFHPNQTPSFWNLEQSARKGVSIPEGEADPGWPDRLSSDGRSLNAIDLFPESTTRSPEVIEDRARIAALLVWLGVMAAMVILFFLVRHP
jgi:hypothetical protein